MDRRKDASLQFTCSLVFSDLPGNKHYGGSGGVRGYKDYRLWCARTLGSNAWRLFISHALARNIGEMKGAIPPRIIAREMGCASHHLFGNWEMDVDPQKSSSKIIIADCAQVNELEANRYELGFRFQADQESRVVMIIRLFKYEKREIVEKVETFLR